MKITIEFNNVEEYLEFKGKTAQEEQVQEQFIDIKSNINCQFDLDNLVCLLAKKL
ncbi:Uncharacterised protein [[Clostridium] sordellii]|uniref:hypothetical protein n=1 Tax=Paraclostridium sordellii TaxID=1505 RepID=UPI0005DDE995|nr:hypothetical protein [Paeniclostridium sordellii]CEQ10657.1 Uncharacterised protein [[Clostridium] sordellii] [Paeniclostridium sordellii]